MFVYTLLYTLLLDLINANIVNVTTYFDCNGHSCYAPLIQPWNKSLYLYPVETLPRLINDTLFLSGAFSHSIDINCFECVLLNKTIIVQKTNRCPPWASLPKLFKRLHY